MDTSSALADVEPTLVADGVPGSPWQSVTLVPADLSGLRAHGITEETAWLSAWAVTLGCQLARAAVLFGHHGGAVSADLTPQRAIADMLGTAVDGEYDTAFGTPDGDRFVIVIEPEKALLHHRIDSTHAQLFASRLELALSAIAASPGAVVGDLELLTTQERHDALVGWQGRVQELASTTLTELVDTTVRRTPEATAVRFEGRSVSYGELDTRANQLARHLIELGVGRGDLVAVAVPRSVELMVALLGVLKIGAGYLPVDRRHPPERIALMLEEAKPAAVLTAGAVIELPGEWPVLTLDAPEIVAALDARPGWPLRGDLAPSPDDVAYVIYTSGSTGRPKGVVVTHSAVVNRLLWMQSWYPLTEHDRVVQKTPITFDVSVPELFAPLIAGAVLLMARPDGHRDPAYLAALITGERATSVHFVPSMLQVFLREPAAAGCTSLRRVFCSGEALSPEAREQCLKLFDVRLINLYGPTEAAVEVTYWDCGHDEPGSPVPIGLPVWNTRLYVLDPALRPVPPGVPGELHLAGAQLASGYLNRDDLTAERFITDPWGPPGARMYRTGDVVRRRFDGVIEYLGRADDQIKIRGFRVELGEIESVVARAAGVAHAAVVARPDRFGETQIVAYPVPSGGGLDLAALREFTERLLPYYMVPAAFVVLDELPVTANGKLDRKRLPEPEIGEVGAGGGARTEAEARLCEVFSEVLELPGVGVDDSFFDLGGHSLLAVRLLSRIRSALGFEVGIQALFEAPTPATLAKVLNGQFLEGAEQARLVPAVRPERLPLSHAQRRMWLLGQVQGPSATYNIPLAVTLHGPLVIDALRAALLELVTRHEILRTGYSESAGEPAQTILAPSVRLDLVSSSPERVREQILAASRQPFDLADDASMRTILFQVGECEHVLLLVPHHIAGDGWSIRPMLRDLATAYATPGRLSPLPVQYVDYALWQNEVLGSAEDPGSMLSRQLGYWEEKLSGAPVELTLPLDRPRPPKASHRGGIVEFTLDTAPLLRTSARHRVTLFMVLHAGLAALLTGLGAGTDLPIGAVVAGRTDEALDELVGFFVNTVVLRTDTTGDPSFAELLDRVRDLDLSAYSNQEAPFDLVIERLNPPRSLGRHPLFQTMIVLQNNASAEFSVPGVRAEVEEIDVGDAKFDLCVTFTQNGDTLDATVEYATDLFDPSTVRLFADALGALLKEVAADSAVRLSGIALPQELLERGQVVADAPREENRSERLPRGPQEVLLLAAFSELLEVTEVGVHSNFFELGGYSLLAMKLVSRIRALFGAEIGIRQLFETPTVAGLAEYLRHASGAVRPAVVRRRIAPENAPLSAAQRRLWFINHVDGPTSTYNVPWAFRVHGELDLEAVRAAVADVADRHEPLRTVFPDVDGVPSQRLLDPGEVTVSVVSAATETAVRYHMTRGFDLATDAPLRVTVFAEGPEEHVVLFQMHHIAVDGWSLQPLASDFAMAYDARVAGTAPDWRPLAVRYVDYSIWQQDLSIAGIESRLTYWRQALDGMPESIDLPVSGNRLDAPAASAAFTLDGETHELLLRLARQNEVTLFMVLQAAVAALLTRIGSGTDLPIGTVVAGRGDDALTELVGFFVNTLVLRTDTSGNPTFSELLARIREFDLAAYAHEDLPFDRLVEAVNPVRSGTNPALCQVMLVLNEGKPPLPELSGLTTGPGPQADPTAKFDLAITFTEQRGLHGLIGLIEYSTGRFDAAVIKMLAEALTALLEAAGRTPDTAIGDILLPALPALPVPQVRAEPARSTPTAPGGADPHVVDVVCRLFGEVLDIAEVGPHDNFFELGGYSLAAAQLVGGIRRELGAEVPVRVLFGVPTPAGVAAWIGAGSQTLPGQSLEPLLTLRPNGSGTPLFCVHPAAGIGWVYSGLLRYVGVEHSVYALQSQALSDPAATGQTYEEMLDAHLARIRQVRPHGPYALLGWSFGGAVAHQLAARLQAEGETVELLAILDGYPERAVGERDPEDPALLRELLDSLGLDRDRDEVSLEEFADIVSHEDSPLAGLPEQAVLGLGRVFAANLALAGVPASARPFRGLVEFFMATVGRGDDVPDPLSWRRHVLGEVSVHAVPFDHGALTGAPALAVIGPVLARCLS